MRASLPEAGVPISFVVPVRNAAADLRRCLQSISAAAGDFESVEIVVVDNGSHDDSAAVARACGVRVLAAPDVRVGAARNSGASAARGTLLAFVDADNEIAPGWLGAARAAFTDAGVGAAGSLCRAPEPGTWVQRAYDRLRARSTKQEEVEWLGAGNAVVLRTAFDAVGGFDAGLEACEDVDLCRRLRRAGYRILNVPGMDNVHHGDPATLRALFRGELWRGRDNLRVSLRGGLTVRSVPGIVLPVVTLATLVLLALALLGARWLGVGPAFAFGALLLACWAPRALLMVRRTPSRSPQDWGRCFVVAATYETGRALSLVWRATHRTRRSPAGVYA